MQSRGRPEGLQRVRHKKPPQPIRPLEQAPIGDTTLAGCGLRALIPGPASAGQNCLVVFAQLSEPPGGPHLGPRGSCPWPAMEPAGMRNATRSFEKIAFVASEVPEARQALERLSARYGSSHPSSADAIVALGGDGLMLQTLHRHLTDGVPIYGMNRGSTGFLMNDYSEEDLRGRLARAEINVIHPLAMRAIDGKGMMHEALAFNEVSLFREIYQAAKLKISVDGRVRLEELICDGVLVATPAGSTAYNLSAYGPILPINAPLLALTPISPFRPRRWRGALLPNAAKIRFDVLEPAKRPVSAVADHSETRGVASVEVEQASGISLFMMFDPGHSLDERILSEQFRY
jgi:NAD+ kinase